MFADFFVLILDLIAIAHTLIALTNLNSTEKQHRLNREQNQTLIFDQQSYKWVRFTIILLTNKLMIQEARGKRQRYDQGP